ncbi:MAG TPA: hypothetical protein VNA57_03655 [Acidimicrobiales bacterium]|nr:hypothetical protein [Acidimicrobiales bacterium]
MAETQTVDTLERQERPETPSSGGRERVPRREPVMIYMLACLVLLAGGLWAAAHHREQEQPSPVPAPAPERQGSAAEGPGAVSPPAMAESPETPPSVVTQAPKPKPPPTPPTTAPIRSRNAQQWPFSSDSIWNMPIGSGATFADPNFFQPPNGYGSDANPIVMSPSSPLRPIHTHAWPARCHKSGDAYSGVSVPIPDDYVVAPDDGNWDGKTPNLSGGVLLADGRTVRELNYFSRCEAGGPASVTTDGMRSTHDLYGNGRPDSFLGGHGGSGLSGVGGSIRRGELIGAAPIRHVTKLTVDMSRWGTREGGRNAHQWPAYVADSDTTSQTYGLNARGYTPILKMGSLLAIPGPVDLDSLGLETRPARKLAEAWQNYGSYVVDNSGFDTGWGQNLLNVEHGVKAEMAAAGINMSTYSSSGWSDTAWNRDMNRLFDQLHHVTNNGPGSIGGGGTPRVALAPPLVP